MNPQSRDKPDDINVDMEDVSFEDLKNKKNNRESNPSKDKEISYQSSRSDKKEQNFDDVSFEDLKDGKIQNKPNNLVDKIEKEKEMILDNKPQKPSFDRPQQTKHTQLPQDLVKKDELQEMLTSKLGLSDEVSFEDAFVEKLKDKVVDSLTQKLKGEFKSKKESPKSYNKINSLDSEIDSIRGKLQKIEDDRRSSKPKIDQIKSKTVDSFLEKVSGNFKSKANLLNTISEEKRRDSKSSKDRGIVSKDFVAKKQEKEKEKRDTQKMEKNIMNIFKKIQKKSDNH